MSSWDKQEEPPEPPFMGMPVEVEGRVDRDYVLPEQKPIDALAPYIQAVLDDEKIVSFGWRQYTPSYSDGEPTRFQVSGVWFRTVEDLPEPPDYPSTNEDVEDPESPWNKLMEMSREERLATYSTTHDLEFRPSSGAHPTLGSLITAWSNEVKVTSYEGNNRELFDKAMALAKELDSSCYDLALEQTFGEGSAVQILREEAKCMVSSYCDD